MRPEAVSALGLNCSQGNGRKRRRSLALPVTPTIKNMSPAIKNNPKPYGLNGVTKSINQADTPKHATPAARKMTRAAWSQNVKSFLSLSAKMNYPRCTTRWREGNRHVLDLSGTQRRLCHRVLIKIATSRMRSGRLVVLGDYATLLSVAV